MVVVPPASSLSAQFENTVNSVFSFDEPHARFSPRRYASFAPRVVWVILAIATLGLALYRKLISASEESLVHLGPGEERRIPEQVALAARLKSIDRWGKTVTVITVAIGLVIAAVYLYRAFLIHK
jgi:hypothetical protein